MPRRIPRIESIPVDLHALQLIEELRNFLDGTALRIQMEVNKGNLDHDYAARATEKIEEASMLVSKGIATQHRNNKAATARINIQDSLKKGKS